MHLSRILPSGLAALAVATALAAADKPAKMSFPAALEDLQLGHKAMIATDTRGNIAVWDPPRRLVGLWDRHGALVETCALDDLALPSDHAGLALRGDTVLLSFFDVAAESDGERRQVIVDLGRCKVAARFNLKGVMMGLTATASDWVMFARSDESPGAKLSLTVVNDKGEIVKTLDVEPSLKRLSEGQSFSAHLGPQTVTQFAVGKDVWVIPAAAYQLWQPPQHGNSLREVFPPECLAATGHELTGQENITHVLELSRNWPDDIRKSLELGAKHGGLSPSFLSATSRVVAWDTFVAVQVRGQKAGNGDRIDIWDMLQESVVAMVPVSETRLLVGFNDSGLWVRVEDRKLERIPLPELWPKRFDPCAALEAIKTGSDKPATPPVASPAPTAAMAPPAPRGTP